MYDVKFDQITSIAGLYHTTHSMKKNAPPKLLSQELHSICYVGYILKFHHSRQEALYKNESTAVFQNQTRSTGLALLPKGHNIFSTSILSKIFM